MPDSYDAWIPLHEVDNKEVCWWWFANTQFFFLVFFFEKKKKETHNCALGGVHQPDRGLG
jgi:hypothetical protein